MLDASSKNRPLVVVVCDDRSQFFAFDDTLHEFGLKLLGCFSAEQVLNGKTANLPKRLIWLIDVHFDGELQDAVDSNQPYLVLVGFTPAPNLSNLQAYQKWQNALIRQLRQRLNLPQIQKIQQTTPKPWRYVLLLGASMGGISALKDFLSHLPAQMPVAIVVAYHFDAKMIHTLPKTLTQNNDWHCQVITTNQSLRSGSCLIVPIDRKIIFDSNGRIFLQNQDWGDGYQPNISAILKNMSDVYNNELISIIFSGMGDDGSKYLSEARSNSSHIWAQSLASSSCISQPKAIIDSGYCQFVGTPIELANQVITVVNASH